MSTFRSHPKPHRRDTGAIHGRPWEVMNKTSVDTIGTYLSKGDISYRNVGTIPVPSIPPSNWRESVLEGKACAIESFAGKDSMSFHAWQQLTMLEKPGVGEFSEKVTFRSDADIQHIFFITKLYT
jgi:hypothetical protein